MAEGGWLKNWTKDRDTGLYEEWYSLCEKRVFDGETKLQAEKCHFRVKALKKVVDIEALEDGAFGLGQKRLFETNGKGG